MLKKIIKLIKINNIIKFIIQYKNQYIKVKANEKYFHIDKSYRFTFIKNYKICFPEFDRNLILKNTNLFYLIKYSDISWFYTMQDRITFVKLMIDLVNKKIEQENN